MKILVTGGAGFIGTNLIKQLVRDRHEVHSLDNYSSGTVDNHVTGCNYISGDLSQIYFGVGDGFDICFHLASVPRIQPSFQNPHETFEVNTRGTESVLDWARLNNVKVIYAGSSSKHHNPHQSPYATYKYLGEEICKMYRHTYNVNVHIARFYNVYGPHEIVEGHMSALIGLWRNHVKLGIPLTIVGDGKQKRDFTHVDDIVDGLLKIMETEFILPSEWELGSGINYSIMEVYEMFKEKFGIDYEMIPNQKGNYKETLCYSPYTVSTLNWHPKDRLKEYINSL